MKKTKIETPHFGPQKLENNKEGMRNRAKNTIGGFLLAAVGVTGIGVAGEMLERQETERNQEMNKVFEPILKPAAEDIAQAAVDKYNQSKEEKWDSSKGYAFEKADTSDPSRYDLFVTQNDGKMTHNLTVTLGKDEKGNFVPSTVVSAQMVDSFDGKQSSVTTIDAGSGDTNYWNGSTGSTTEKFTVGYGTANFGGQYDDLNHDIESAKKIAQSVEKELGK